MLSYVYLEARNIDYLNIYSQMTKDSSTSLKKTIEWLFYPRLRWVYHLLFWMFIYLDEILSFVGLTEEMEDVWTTPFSLSIDMVVVYTTIYILLPLFLLRGRILIFVLSSLFLITLDTIIQLLLWIDFEMIEDEPWTVLVTIFLGTFVNFGLTVGFAAGIKIFKNYTLSESRLQQMETDNLKTELTYLKNQINPHFLFNSLNNIYVLNRKDSKMASESILLLSDLLRYQLYECNHETVSLDGEIEYVKNFLDLDQLRKDNTELIFNVEGSTAGLRIAPYVFLPFIENAIKHGSSADNEKGYLKINIKTDKEQLTFVVENSKPKLPLPTEVGGIGLVNVKRRLELVYPEQYQLSIDNAEKYYKVSLSIDLNQNEI